MKRKNIVYIFVMLLSLIFVSSNVFAVDIYDTLQTENVYKLSEDSSEFKIPFVRISNDRMELDKSISQVGAFVAQSTIDVNADLSGIQVFYSSDSVRINSSIDYAAVITSGNVVINGNVNDTLFIYTNSDVTLSESANIKGNLIVYANNLTLNGKVDGNVLGKVGTLNINNEVGQKVKMDVSNVTTTENAKVIEGFELNTSNSGLKIDESVGASKIDVVKSQSGFKSTMLKVLMYTISDIVVFILLLIFIKNDGLTKITNSIQGNKIVKKGINGLLAFILCFCFGIVILFALSNFGIALIVFSIAMIVIFALIKNAVFGTLVVKLMEPRYKEANIKMNNIVSAILVFLVLELVEAIPYVGIVISIIVFIFAIGIVLSMFKFSTDDSKIEVVNAKKETEQKEEVKEENK